MTWSTSQLAQLAGTTVAAVRRYREVGLLDEPGRTANGYEHYDLAHLVRLLQITGLAELGVPLTTVAPSDAIGPSPDLAMHALDVNLESTVARLVKLRCELASLRTGRAPAELPNSFIDVADKLSGLDRLLVMFFANDST